MHTYLTTWEKLSGKSITETCDFDPDLEVLSEEEHEEQLETACSRFLAQANKLLMPYAKMYPDGQIVQISDTDWDFLFYQKMVAYVDKVLSMEIHG